MAKYIVYGTAVVTCSVVVAGVDSEEEAKEKANSLSSLEWEVDSDTPDGEVTVGDAEEVEDD